MILTLAPLVAEAGKNKPTRQDDVRQISTQVAPTTCAFDGNSLTVSGRTLLLGSSIGAPAANFDNLFQPTFVTQDGRTQAGPALPIQEDMLEVTMMADPKAWLISACTGAARAQGGLGIAAINVGLKLQDNVEHAVVYGAIGNVSIEPYVLEQLVDQHLLAASKNPMSAIQKFAARPFDIQSLASVDVGYMCVLSVASDSESGGISFGPLKALSVGGSAEAGLGKQLCPPELSERLTSLKKPDQTELLNAASALLYEYAVEAVAAGAAPGGPLPGVVLGQVISAPRSVTLPAAAPAASP